MEDLSDLALEAAERYTLTGEPLSKIIANIALREALTTEQIKRVVENANRAVFAKLFSNGVHEFDIAKLEDVLSVLHDNGGVESNDSIPENEETEYNLDGLEESNMDDGALNLFRELFGVSEEESAKLNKKPEDDSTIVIKLTKIKQAAEELKGANQEFELDYNTLVKQISQALKYLTPSKLQVELLKRIPKGVNRTEYEQVIRQAISDAQQLIQQNPDSYVHTKVSALANLIYSQGDKSIMKVAVSIWQNDISPQDIIDTMHATYRTSAFDKYIVKAAQYAIELSKNAEVSDDVIDKIASAAADTVTSLNEFKQKAEQLNNLKSEGQETPKLEKQIMQVAERVVKLLKPQSAIRKMETF